MKKIALITSTLALTLSPVLAHAGGEVGPVLAPAPIDQEQPQAVIPGGIGGAPVAGGAVIPAAALIGLGALTAAGIAAVVLLDDDDDDDSTSSTTTN